MEIISMKENITRRFFLGLSAGLTVIGCGEKKAKEESSPDIHTVPSFELDEVTLSEIHDGIKSGKFTAAHLTEKYLERIQAIDKDGPKINSVIELNPDALQIAEGLDAEQKTNGLRGPLHGIPLLIKDNISTSDKMKTTAGSLALANSTATRDAFIVKKLRDAGAVILGKTNLSEWANFRSSKSTSGWSGRGGQTNNPYSLDRNPSGSSSGSGAAVAANLSAIAIGTETDGSIVSPSSLNCIVGLKPTIGLVSRSGIIPISHNQDTAGPMARTVADAAILLSVLTGADDEDSATQSVKGKGFTDYTQFLNPDGMKGARIGVARQFCNVMEAVDRQFNNLLDEMKRLGATIIDPLEAAGFKKFREFEFEVLMYDFKADLNKYLSALAPDVRVHSLKELIEFNERNREKEMPFFGQDIFIKSEAKGPLSSPEYKKALSECRRFSREEGIDAAIRQHRLDAIVAPTSGPPSLTDHVTGDHYLGGSSSPAAVAGYPNITIPAGFVFGLPFGISFFGAAFSEGKLIKIAYALEQATKIRRPPRFLKTADLKV